MSFAFYIYMRNSLSGKKQKGLQISSDKIIVIFDYGFTYCISGE